MIKVYTLNPEFLVDTWKCTIPAMDKPWRVKGIKYESLVSSPSAQEYFIKFIHGGVANIFESYLNLPALAFSINARFCAAIGVTTRSEYCSPYFAFMQSLPDLDILPGTIVEFGYFGADGVSDDMTNAIAVIEIVDE